MNPDLKKILWAAAEKLRFSMDAAVDGTSSGHDVFFLRVLNNEQKESHATLDD